MILPRLRNDLNVMPSPDPNNPGIYVSDHYRYTDGWLIIPSLLVQGLKYFDGVHTDLDVKVNLVALPAKPIPLR